MSKKKILIIHPGSLYPNIMAFQDRVINMTKVLNEKHSVELVVLYKTKEEKKLHEKNLPFICNNFYLIPSPNNSLIKRKTLGVVSFFIQKVFNLPGQMIYPNWPTIKRRIINIVKTNNYDIVQIETWWQCNLFKYVSDTTLKVIDTHDVMYEKRILERKYQNKGILSKKDKKNLEKYKKIELKNTGFSDLIISISKHDNEIFLKHFTNKKHLFIPMGQNLADFINYPKKDDDKTILFYGNMGGKQNIIAFWRLYNVIYPKIRKNISKIKLIVLGANPPSKIKDLDNGDSIIITDYVKDVREYIAKSSLMILPLVTSGGFRSRVVEVMVMGVPVIGTHNALDSIEMSHGIHGFITDSDEKMATYAIKLLSDIKLRTKISKECIKFVKKNYTIESTYGRLSKYYSELVI